MNYKSLDKYELKGRGTVYVVENDIDRDRDEFKTFIDKEIEIDGIKHICRGVESYCIPFISQGTPIGILVG